MKRFLLLAPIALSILLLAQCAPKVHSTVASSAPTSAQTVAELKKKYTDADMGVGNSIRQEKCNKCHKQHDPTEFTVEKWDRILPRMTSRAHLSTDDAGKVRAYILANARLN